eukprot:8630359-Ditylum_brightwellii.AAC.1
MSQANNSSIAAWWIPFLSDAITTLTTCYILPKLLSNHQNENKYMPSSSSTTTTIVSRPLTTTSKEKNDMLMDSPTLDQGILCKDK